MAQSPMYEGYSISNGRLMNASFKDSFTEVSNPDGVFHPGETISPGSSSGAFTMTYLGHSAEGGIFIEAFGSTYYFAPVGSNHPDYSPVPQMIAGDQVVCFVQGTHISTSAGPRAVETLSIGDEVLNVAGEAVKIKWIGRQTRHAKMAALDDNLPIMISAGALGHGLPLRNLYVSPDHAMLVEGCLVHASALVNGRTILRMTQWQGNVEYYHIETENHELILAEGAATETFVDNVSREKFDNHAEFAALYPNAAPMVELDLPRVCFKRQLPRAIARVLDRVADELVGKGAVAA